MSSAHEVDLVIAGGGIAGLWLANLLAARGYELILLEGDTLGSAQTLASQGMIHGGVKYSLGGTLSRAHQAISAMPARWRDNLAGRGELDLRDLKPLSQRYYLFAQDSALDKLAGFFASKAMRGSVERLEPRDYPPAFQDSGFNGVVYSVNELVIDTRALLQTLHARVAGRAFHHRLAGSDVSVDGEGVCIDVGDALVRARHLLLCAGAGNGPLLADLAMTEPRMQLRPLHQAVVRHAYPHPMFAHCLTGLRRPEPRLTITSHPVDDGALWYLGGALASDGVDMTAEALGRHALGELRACVPWINWEGAQVETLRIDRAEPLHPKGKRPDQAFAEAYGPVIVCWPTKLSLTPDLGDRVAPLLSAPAKTNPPTLSLPPASLGHAPWEV